MESESTLSTFVAADGENIAVQDWHVDPGDKPRGVVLLVHGLGEHAGRYENVALQLNSWGFGVRGYDQYGHGESGGVRGGLPSDTRLIDDLADIVDSTRSRFGSTRPLILLGHSMGGLVASRFVGLGVRKVEGLVMTSPALDPGLSAVQKALLATLPRWLPNLRVGNGVNPDFVSRDRAVVAAYRADRLVHDRISARFGKFIADGGAATLAEAPHWSLPTLLMFAGQDKLVNPKGSRAFAAAAPKSVVTTHCFDALYHEIFNEPEQAKVLARLKTWLDARF